MKLAAALWDRYSEMKPSDRRAMVLLSVFLISVAGYVFLLEPLVLSYQQTQRELDELSKQESGYLQKVRMLPRREAKLSENAAALEALKRQFETIALTPQAAISNIISELSHYAKLCEVQIAGIRPLEAEAVGRFVETPVEIEAEGEYAGLHKFFYFVETSASLLAITDLELRPQKNGRLSARVKLSNIAAKGEGLEQPAATQGAVTPENHLRIILPPWAGYAPLIIAERNGYFSDQGFQVDLIRLDDAAAAEQLLASGVADGVGVALSELQALRGKGIDLAVVLPIASSLGAEGILVATESPVRSVADLKHRSLAVDTRGVLHFVLFDILERNGLSLDDVNTEHRQAGMIAREISGGTLEAGLTREPYLSALVRNGQARLLVSSEGMEGLVVDFLAVNRGIAEEKDSALLYLLQGLLRAQRFISDNPQQTARIVAEWHGQPDVLVKKMLSKIQFFGVERAREFFASAEMDRLIPRYEEYFRAIKQPWPRLRPGDESAAALFDLAAESLTEGSYLGTDNGKP